MACSVAAERGQARVEMDSSARRRVGDGALATEQASGRIEARAAELLRAALHTEALARSESFTTSRAAEQRKAGTSGDGPSPRHPVESSSAAAGTGPSGTTSAPAPRVERAMALVERIERFVRSGRPALALTLRGGLPGRLELQRVGPGVVSLRLSSTRPPVPSELGQLRQALEARGLKLHSLESRLLTASAADACSPCP